MRQLCDNLGVVCSTSKGLSMRRPLSFVLQASAVLCMWERVNLRVSHIAGVRNVWADALSRGQQFALEIWSQLCASNQCHRDWRSLLELGRFGLADRITVLSGHSRFGLESGLGSWHGRVHGCGSALGGDIIDRGGSGGMCPASTSVEDFSAKSVRPCHMVSGVHYRCSEGWEVCGGVGWDMATAYAEPSPNLCAHVMLCQVAASVCSGAAHCHGFVC